MQVGPLIMREEINNMHGHASARIFLFLSTAWYLLNICRIAVSGGRGKSGKLTKIGAEGTADRLFGPATDIPHAFFVNSSSPDAEEARQPLGATFEDPCADASSRLRECMWLAQGMTGGGSGPDGTLPPNSGF